MCDAYRPFFIGIEKRIIMAKYNRGFARSDRVKEQLLRELAELIRKDLKDPRVGFVTLTEVEVTRDYAHAKVYFTVLDEVTRKETQKILDHSIGFLRKQLGKRIRLFNTPQLHFVYDEAVVRGMNLSRLIDQVALEYQDKDAQEIETDNKDDE